MKYLLVFLLIPGAFAWQPAPAKPAPKTEHKKAAPLTVPEGAVELEPGLFKYTDKAGKTSYYRRLPLGVVLTDAPKTTPQADAIQAFDQGETVKFKRPGPFGVYTWTRKKTELDEFEKAAFEQIKPASAKPASIKPASTQKEQ